MIQHVSRAVRPEAVEPCILFYGLLGFREVSAPAGLVGSVRWLELSPAVSPGHATQLHLLLHDDPRPEQGHFAMVVDPYEPTLRRLRDHGHVPDPHPPYWGAERAFVRDPAGNLVELMERAPQ